MSVRPGPGHRLRVGSPSRKARRVRVARRRRAIGIRPSCRPALRVRPRPASLATRIPCIAPGTQAPSAGRLGSLNRRLGAGPSDRLGSPGLLRVNYEPPLVRMRARARAGAGTPAPARGLTHAPTEGRQGERRGERETQRGRESARARASERASERERGGEREREREREREEKGSGHIYARTPAVTRGRAR